MMRKRIWKEAMSGWTGEEGEMEKWRLVVLLEGISSEELFSNSWVVVVWE